MLTRKRLWALLLLITTFGVGAAVGGAASAAWGDHDRPRATTRSDRRERFISMLERELKLSPAQRDSVQAILKRYDPAMRAVWNQMRPKFDSLRAGIHAEITRVLDDQQRVAFQRWNARTDSAARQRAKETDGAR